MPRRKDKQPGELQAELVSALDDKPRAAGRLKISVEWLNDLGAGREPMYLRDAEVIASEAGGELLFVRRGDRAQKMFETAMAMAGIPPEQRGFVRDPFRRLAGQTRQAVPRSPRRRAAS